MTDEHSSSSAVGASPRPSLLTTVGRPFTANLTKAGYDASDPELAFRTQVVVLYAATSAAVAFSYAGSHWQRGAVGLTLLFLAFGAGTLAQLEVLRRTGRVALVAHVALAIATIGTSVATYFTGGLRMTNICPFFIIIVASIFLLSWKGLPWAVLAILVPAGFEAAALAEVRFPDHVPPADRAADAVLTWAVGIVVVFLFVVCYEAARLLSLRRRIAAEAARSQFLANVSHELRTPLHAIMGMTSQALRADPPADLRESLETSLHNADSLRVLINDLLDLASMQRDRFVLHEQDFDPVDVVERVAKVVRFRCQDKGLDFALEVDGQIPRWVRGDGDRLQQVLTNLGANAVKYTMAGSVEMAVRPAEVDGEALACRFSVADTGIGIEEAQRERLFDPYTKAAGAGVAEQEGSGLGLSIVRDLVDAMGGRIEIESAPDEGSAFHVTLAFSPPHGEPPSAEPAGERAGADGAPLRVLLVDDDRLNLQMGTLMLEELQHEVVAARDGEEAIRRWDEDRPDVILMDLQMPGMDGLEAIRRIRQCEGEEGGPRAPILAVTGHGTTEHREQCLAAGADGCLFKPFRFEELRDALRGVTRAAG